MASEPPGAAPEPAPETDDYPRPPGWRGRMMAANPEQARRWMRWAWLASLAWWVLNTGLLLVWLVASVIPPEVSGTEPADSPVPARIVIYYGVEGFLIGMLGLGLNFRVPLAGMLLPAVFLIARVIAITRLEPLHLDLKALVWVVVYLLLLFLFLRGAQGAWTWRWFTRPPLPERR